MDADYWDVVVARLSSANHPVKAFIGKELTLNVIFGLP